VGMYVNPPLPAHLFLSSSNISIAGLSERMTNFNASLMTALDWPGASEAMDAVLSSWTESRGTFPFRLRYVCP
jgi:hypothetical protein